jgi:hypothetical protein
MDKCLENFDRDPRIRHRSSAKVLTLEADACREHDSTSRAPRPPP